MRVLLTGATGFIGSALLPQLLERGHTVTALVRDEGRADAVRGAGADARVVDLADGARVSEAAAAHDGLLHLAATDPDVDRAFATAAVAGLAASGKPYVHTGGCWVYGPGDAISETDPYDPPEITAWRLPVLDVVAAGDVPFTIVHPGIVHAPGQGIPQVIADGPCTEDGRLVTVGSGEQHWTTIHVDDLAALYVAVLEAGSGFGAVLGVSGHNPRVLDLTAAAAHGAGVATETDDAARARLGGPYADALLIDQQADGEKARSIGGWRPTRPTLTEELGG